MIVSLGESRLGVGLTGLPVTLAGVVLDDAVGVELPPDVPPSGEPPPVEVMPPGASASRWSCTTGTSAATAAIEELQQVALSQDLPW